jgi:alkanesulfonate monooxygenase SsuD/methylene tetrahydromethanopterin reductase-like flavin-dependent oxidoreductase (luciferase family)
MFFTLQSVSFDGDYEHVTGAGLAPMPVQRPIPIWVGASSEPALKRAGRLADGWFPQVAPRHGLEEAVAVVRAAALAAGRDPSALAMEGRVNAGAGTEKLAERLGRWREAGATHMSINTMGAGHAGADAHIAVLRMAAEVALA